MAVQPMASVAALQEIMPFDEEGNVLAGSFTGLCPDHDQQYA